MKLRSKLLKKDYNQELEEIAESKRFEKEAQNLLLSMLYKVEASYDDYKTVKREVPTKEAFLQNIIDIVKKYCKEIEIARPNSLLEKELTKSRCKILEEEPDNKYNNEQKIIFFPNEKVVLYSIIRAGIEKINPKLSLKDKAMLMTIQIGKCIAYSESIRDFNGFSWTTGVSEIESLDCNIVYTDLIYLLGEKNISCINSSNIGNLKSKIDKELYENIQKIALRFYLSYDEKQSQNLKENLKKDKKLLEDMSNQKVFVENISNHKKKILLRIKEIDETLNSPEDLRKEYLNKNKSLPNEKKIFSISHYEEMLQKERKELLEKIEESNKYQNPIEFVKIKNELENRIKYYESLEDIDLKAVEERFLEVFKQKIEKEKLKENILDYLYEVRYLKYLPVNNSKVLKDIINFEDIEKVVINKGLEFNLITPISNNKETDYLLLKSILNTKNINLNELYIRLEVKDGKLESEIYDGDVLDSTNYINLKKGSSVQIRKTKKVKIFS